MKVTVHAEGTASEIAAQLNEHAAVYFSAKGVGEKPVKRSEKLKAADAEEAPAEDEDAGFGEEETPEEADDAEPTLDDVITACQKHAKKSGGREATQAVLLKKFKVKNVKELKSSQFALVIATLAK